MLDVFDYDSNYVDLTEETDTKRKAEDFEFESEKKIKV